jgi:hypothetical protein
LAFDAGDVNFYRYVGNNPTNATDPSGLKIEINGKPWNDDWDTVKGEFFTEEQNKEILSPLDNKVYSPNAKEIWEAMSKSTEVFNFKGRGEDAADADVAAKAKALLTIYLRMKVIDYMQQVKNGTIKTNASDVGRVGLPNWEGGLGMFLTKGKWTSASQGLDSLTKPGITIPTECNGTVALCLLLAVRDVLGRDRFDGLHPVENFKKPLSLSTRYGVSTDHLVKKKINLKMGKQEGAAERGLQEGGAARQAVLNGLIPGDMVHFSNAPDFNQKRQQGKSNYWQGEWTVYMGIEKGKQLFVGQGFTEYGADAVYKKLAMEYTNATNLKLDPDNLEKYMAIDEILQPSLGLGDV